ncbi:stAR-related lipid transfer protein 13 [Toxorhynchites rutilus septentrionalis]|uniref:stAR-related lipid transfer protein 13 n=1 Tax=Toxorhynchites rutilus septentrionalis TaxID=329112 RepID=UPI0024790022|nr:stAR-related lipid transfer protein 13 [Toxorhynchites rutilus septentrionalis]
MSSKNVCNMLPQCDSNENNNVIDADVANTKATTTNTSSIVSPTTTTTATPTATSTITSHDHTATMCKTQSMTTSDSGLQIMMASAGNVNSTNTTDNSSEMDMINSKDPYAELERYLEKVKAEISEVFAQLESKRDENGPEPSSSERVHPRLAMGPKQCVNVTRSENRDRNHNTEASICQNVACASDSVNNTNLEATERLLREIVASLPTQQQFVSSQHHHHSSRERNNGAFESARYYVDPTFVISSDHHRHHYIPQHHELQQQLVLKIDEDDEHDKSEQRSHRFNNSAGRSLAAGATDNSQSSDYDNNTGSSSRELHDSFSDDMSLLEELSVYDSHEQEEDCSDSKEAETSPKLFQRNQQSPALRPQQLVQDKLKTSTNSLPSTNRNFSLHYKFRNHQNVIDAKRRQFFLPLEQEPFQSVKSNITDLPSPSSTSLHSGYSHLIVEDLGAKSSSAPLLMKSEEIELGERRNLRYSRSQSDRHLAEIEAVEACRWLRAAGFPQYAQMYEDHQFPIEINDVAKDHPFLENDPLQSLYRRLHTLNRCANMHIDTHQHTHPPKPSEDSDEDSCALSEAWTFAHNSRRWSRVEDAAGLVSVIKQKHSANKSDVSTLNETDSAEDSSKSGSKTTADEKESWCDDGVTLSILSDSDQQDGPVRLRRTGSERLKDGAKAFLRRVESIKSRRRKRQNRDGLIICGPHSSGLSPVHHAVDELKHIDVLSFSNPSSPRPSSAFGDHRRENVLGTNEIVSNLLSPYTLSPFGHMAEDKKEHKRSTNRSSPLHFFIQLQEAKSGDDSSSICSEDSQDLNTGYFAGRIVKTPSKKYPKAKKLLRNKVKADDSGALSDSEYQAKLRRAKVTSDLKETNSNNLQVSKLNRGGSLNLGKSSKRYRDAFHNRSMRVAKTNDEKGEDRKRTTVARWHSFQQPKNSEDRRLSTIDFKGDNLKDKGKYSGGTSIYEMSCGQLMVVRKFALVTLTGYMERYCPTHRSGWNWDLPKFIKRIKTPDYKDRRIFGIPLVLNLQRYGSTLPEIIQMALTWLELNALDQVGLFRKPGVKSRIAKLKSTIESSNNVSNRMKVFDEHHAYDVADMLKQYFRELPDPLLTAKLSETFVAIFQYLPEEVRAEAVQSAILLLPDEHREVLYALLNFLDKVVATASINQMTSNNLAVCLSPSLFYSMSGSRSSTASPRRKKGATGQPDEKELSEARASHDCLAYLIQHYRSLWTISSDRMRKCSFNYMEESKPVPLESLGAELHVQNWRGYLTECIKECVREGKERPRGWVSLSSADPNVNVFFKKVGDGHPLRLWKTVTEVEAPPTEVINHILNERHLWDDHLVKSRIVERLDSDTDVFQYVCGQPITDYCVLRQWNKQQTRGACVIVEVSITHNGAQLLLDGVRGVVLASRYLIEPCGSGKCKLMHLSRVDMKGRTPDWYNKNYGHICQQYLSRIKKFFEHYTEGPESKV